MRERLASGRRLCGEASPPPTTFAALAARGSSPQYGVGCPRPEQLPPAARRSRGVPRAPAGVYALELFARHRRTGRARRSARAPRPGCAGAPPSPPASASASSGRAARIGSSCRRPTSYDEHAVDGADGSRSRCARWQQRHLAEHGSVRAPPRSTSVPSSRRRKTSIVSSTTATAIASWPWTMIRSIGPNVSGRAEPASSTISSARRIVNGTVPASRSASTRSGGWYPWASSAPTSMRSSS